MPADARVQSAVMTTLAGEWYQNALVWTVVGILVTLAVGLLAAWATIRANNPKLTLAYGLQSNTRLVSGPGGLLTVTYGGVSLTDPHMAEIQIANEGRKDIVSGMFHGGTPLELDLGQDILAVLDTTSRPPTVSAPSATYSGAKLSIAPAHLARKQRVTYAVLLDGPANPLSVNHSLIDVTVREMREDGALFQAVVRQASAASAMAALASAMAALLSN